MGVTALRTQPENRSYTRSLSVLSLGMPSRDYTYRLEQKHKYCFCLPPGRIVRCPSVFPYCWLSPGFNSYPVECISLQA